MRPLNSRHRDPALERALPRAALMLRGCALVDASVEEAVTAAAHAGRRPCPFLLAGGCAVYAVRPLACRRYLVLDRPCAPGEDCTESRPADMLIPARSALSAALAVTFPWYGARWQSLGLPEPPDAAPESAAAQAWLASVTVPLQRLAWN